MSPKGIIRIPEMKGQVFGKLTVLRFLGVMERRRSSCWLCQCDCGNTTEVLAVNLRRGKTTSCGCMRGLHTHNQTYTREYATWKNMKQRCTNPKSPSWKWYGGRGITICKRWLNSFENFYKDMGTRPKGMSIDRENNKGNYTPKNCRWATPIEQANNKRAYGSAK